MPPINEIPLGVYPDVTGVIDATAAPEVVALLAAMLAYIPDPEAPDAQTAGVPGEAPDYDRVPPAFCVHIRAEIAAMQAAIAAAPTV